MSNIERSPIAIVQECARDGCEFYGGIARVECVKDGHSVGVDYVRASQLTGTVERASKMHEEFVAERRMLREWLAELGATDEQMAARYAPLGQ